MQTRMIGGRRLPAINVKVRGASCYYDADKVAKHFKCDRATAEKALEFALDSAREMFWEDAQEEITERFGPPAKVFSDGRSGGWLVVQGLLDVDCWEEGTCDTDSPAEKWEEFEKWVREDIMARAQDVDGMLEKIDANRWAEPGAERYNFHDAKGVTECAVDRKRREAASADLLAALELSLEFLKANDDGEDDVRRRIEASEAAIKKATEG